MLVNPNTHRRMNPDFELKRGHEGCRDVNHLESMENHDLETSSLNPIANKVTCSKDSVSLQKGNASLSNDNPKGGGK